MPLQIVRNDITRMQVDAIVNASNRRLIAEGGVSTAIHKAAGEKLAAACKKLGGCEVGQAKITEAFALPCKYVIHTVGPIWQGGTQGEAEALAACYKACLTLAVQHKCRSIAFPVLASGAHGYPKQQALQVAVNAIGNFLLQNVEKIDLQVYLVTFTKESFVSGTKLFADVQQYIDDTYVEEHLDLRRENARRLKAVRVEEDYGAGPMMAPQMEMCSAPSSLEEALEQLDESFGEMLMRLIKEKGLKTSKVYGVANIDRKLFSKIVSNPQYKTKKTTALALAIALQLDLYETAELLYKAGFVLSHSSKFDVIVEYFILNGNYDIFQINAMLYEFDQPLLGAQDK